MNCISAQLQINNVEFHAPRTLLAEDTLLRHPLKCTHHRFLDLADVLNSLGHIDEHVGSCAEDVGSCVLCSKAPYFAGLIFLPTEFFD